MDTYNFAMKIIRCTWFDCVIIVLGGLCQTKFTVDIPCKMINYVWVVGLPFLYVLKVAFDYEVTEYG